MRTTLAIDEQPLAYIRQLEPRPLAAIDLIVMHCTELPDLAMARAYAERLVYPSGTGNSGHYYIDRDGSVARYVPEDRVAHHVHGHNQRSLGIELVNMGRYPDWFDARHQAMQEPYPEMQIAALVDLLAYLHGHVPNLRNITGHEDLDTGTVPASNDAAHRVQRKLDPGPQFPWPQVLSACGLERLARSV